MKKPFLVFGIVVMTVFSTCDNKCPPLTTSQKAEIEKQILGIIDKIYASIAKLEVEGYAVYLSSDEFLGFHGCGVELPIMTKTELVDRTRAWFSERTKQEISNVEVKVSVLSADYVLVDRTANWKISFTDGQTYNFIHAASFIFKKESSGWKIIHLDEWGRTI